MIRWATLKGWWMTRVGTWVMGCLTTLHARFKMILVWHDRRKAKTETGSVFSRCSDGDDYITNASEWRVSRGAKERIEARLYCASAVERAQCLSVKCRPAT
ncbi:hypothetical protein C8R48DRAFT_715644 [Suillus tomentosus]|nr:hypothetical protein C8R48DRAFT_715644 [Suillus tomentosus]